MFCPVSVTRASVKHKNGGKRIRKKGNKTTRAKEKITNNMNKKVDTLHTVHTFGHVLLITLKRLINFQCSIGLLILHLSLSISSLARRFFSRVCVCVLIHSLPIHSHHSGVCVPLFFFYSFRSSAVWMLPSCFRIIHGECLMYLCMDGCVHKYLLAGCMHNRLKLLKKKEWRA